MSSIIIDNKKIIENIKEEVKQNIKGCIIRPSVAVIEIGDNKLRDEIIKAKEDACNEAGIYFRHYKYEDTTPELTIINKIKELNNDDYVNGIMIQLPIPEKYNEKRLFNTIINSKDLDGLTDINVGRLISGRKTMMPSPTLAIMTMLRENEIELDRKEIVIVGKGKQVGRPLTNLLLNEGATVTVCHSRTRDLKKHTINADIVITATGVKDLITDDMIKSGAVVIDAGLRLEDGKIYGDVEFSKVSKKASLITPKENGIFDLTVAMFLNNLYLCYKNKK